MVSYPAIAAFFHKLTGRDTEAKRILILGLDAAGKTSILYRLALKEVITTIPTIGFNVETVKIGLPDSKSLNVTAWDVGGCDKIRPLWRHYFSNTSGVLFIVDSNDRERFAEAVEELFVLRSEFDNPQYGGIIPPFLVFANKQDLSKAMSPAEVQQKLLEAKPSVKAPEAIKVFPLHATGPKGVFQKEIDAAFTWFHDMIATGVASQGIPLSTPSKQEEDAPQTASNDPRSPGLLAKRLESWVERAENDIDADEFLKYFYAYELPSWDHYTHIRLAYIILGKYGRQKGKNMIFDGIEAYIKNSSRTTGRTFHLTMTYFWIQMVHHGMASMPQSSGAQGVDPFTAFLIFNPHLCDGMLWSDYYEKGTIMAPEAKENMMLPDKKALPNVIQREAPKKQTV